MRLATDEVDNLDGDETLPSFVVAIMHRSEVAGVHLRSAGDPASNTNDVVRTLGSKSLPSALFVGQSCRKLMIRESRNTMLGTNTF